MSNFFDDERLFAEYEKMRSSDDNHTDAVIIPSLLKCLPQNFDGMRVLDVCCGFGKTTEYFALHGADFTVGVDISQKMIDKARAEHAHPRISYVCSDVEKLRAEPNEFFDLIVSTAALHFIEDLQSLFDTLYSILNDGGVLCFSMEHPCMSSETSMDGHPWIFNRDGSVDCFCMRRYYDESSREGAWLQKDIIIKIYHRTFSTIINMLIRSGFTIEELHEPAPVREGLTDLQYQLYYTRPSILIVKCKKHAH